ncbi:MAG: hypothetical protein LBC53_03355 [Spirochaetaceae bacterium]|nr:hypothetical protein [Spirochaetaceae bacterium]
MFHIILQKNHIRIAHNYIYTPIFDFQAHFSWCGFGVDFFAVECANFRNKKISIFICSCLIHFGIINFLLCRVTRKKENANFTRFYNYAYDAIEKYDLFIFHTASGQLAGVFAYLFPGADYVYKFPVIGPDIS